MDEVQTIYIFLPHNVHVGRATGISTSVHGSGWEVFKLYWLRILLFINIWWRLCSARLTESPDLMEPCKHGVLLIFRGKNLSAVFKLLCIDRVKNICLNEVASLPSPTWVTVKLFYLGKFYCGKKRLRDDRGEQGLDRGEGAKVAWKWIYGVWAEDGERDAKAGEGAFAPPLPVPIFNVHWTCNSHPLLF